MQRSEEIGWPAALPYVETYLSTCRSIRDAPPIQQVLETVVARLNSKNTMQVVLEAEAGSSEATLDMILRSCTGVGARKDPVIAFQYIDKLLHPRPPLQVAPSDRAHGLALLAHLFYEDSRSQGPNTLNTDALSRAAIPANQAASMGFVCPIILQIAQMIERTGFRNPANIPPDRTSNPFQELPDLWRVWDMRVAEIAGKDEERDEKVRQNPNLYFCARRGCGIEAIHKSALRSCGGKCPPHGKPAYCSRECQKEDWRRHKPFCQAEGPIDDVVTALRENAGRLPPDPAVDDALGPSGIPGIVPRAYDEIASGRHARSVVVPGPDGQPMGLRSSTMTPEFMRDVQREIARLAAERGVQL